MAAALGLLLTAEPAQAQLQPASARALGQATRTCLDVARPRGIQRSVLAKNGWRPGALMSDGKQVEQGMEVFGKAGNPALVMIGENAGPPPSVSCVILARLGDPSDYASIAEAQNRLYGAPIDSAQDNHVWRAGKRLVFLTPGDIEDYPSARLSVVAFRGSDE